MTFHHRTTEAAWEAIQAEGVLWGMPSADPAYRYTYLSSPSCTPHEGYGPVLLEVDYDPVGVDGSQTDNYSFDLPDGMVCWQFSVFIPIQITNVRRKR